LRNLTRYPKGTSGNPSGKSSSLNEIMRMARSHAPECIAKLLSIIRNENSSDRDVIAACIAMLDRGCGKAIVPVYKGEHGLPHEMVGAGIGDGDWTPLLGAAGKGPAAAYRRALQEELSRLDAEASQEKAAREEQLAKAQEDARDGKPLPDSLRLLLAVKNEE
jgi:hypothetical protein